MSLKNFKSEIKKITWPSAKEVTQKTGIVLVVCAIMSAIIAAFDALIRLGLDAMDNAIVGKGPTE